MTERQQDDPCAHRLRDSFARQPLMESLGAVLTRVEAGTCEIRVPWAARLCSERGGVHPGVSAALAETAAVLAACSRLPAEVSLLTMEQKLDLGAPACGDALLVIARVEREGPSLFVVRTEVLAETGAARKTVAVLLATMMVVRNGEEAPFVGHWHLNEPRGGKAARVAA
ncbi:PaaI family thioesterase [Azospirillum sp. sgz302134]